jgi:protein-L-isoaspartate O-methyltransferase
VLPIGTPEAQTLVQVEKRRGQVLHTEVAACVFVPLVGQYGWPEAPGA